ncbi:DUF3054 domain-containing protein [Arthrobacter zhangbolii]|uniref:DUF3054 domain-containing protein n=2 Tax=Arthrobacter zhangbolii TaxID=2886936 RepID=A0A9X1M4U9_9MICC|nr:DUF3054 domain-containing protein [Arthrobacter zhangbolii]MCC3271443.1 DUF3054 domain-containing protein [Arthrobacter zhangbolii]
MNMTNTPRSAEPAGASRGTAASRAQRRSWPVLLGADLVLITIFAALGRQSHEHGLAVTGILLTALPFILTCLAAWAVMRAWRRPGQLWPAGVVIWLSTVAAGLGIRALAGGGTAPSFQLVTLLVLGAFLLGHRLVWHVVSRRGAQNPRPERIN